MGRMWPGDSRWLVGGWGIKGNFVFGFWVFPFQMFIVAALKWVLLLLVLIPLPM